MENIITDLRLHPALLNELCSGRKFREAKRRAIERACAQEANATRGHKTIPGLGKKVLDIPEDDYYDIIAKEGYEFFDHRENVKFIQKVAPEFAGAKV